MRIELLNITLFDHYKSLELLSIEIGNWVGHLLFLDWDGDQVEWDFLFINAGLRALG